MDQNDKFCSARGRAGTAARALIGQRALAGVAIAGIGLFAAGCTELGIPPPPTTTTTGVPQPTTTTTTGPPPEATTTTVKDNPNPSTVDSEVSISATVSVADESQPTGTVTFADTTDDVTMGTAQVTNGTATISYTFTQIGTPTVEAKYSGGAGDAASSGTTTQTVESAP